ncbi:MAG: hypothetical protein JW798_07085 [Prolixibacteraceae bacterium]|nr:hypothetical protein [Prolixibacteraceae bacterium]
MRISIRIIIPMGIMQRKEMVWMRLFILYCITSTNIVVEISEKETTQVKKGSFHVFLTGGWCDL